MSYLPDVSLEVLAMEKSADICAVFYPFSHRGGFGRAALTPPSSRIKRGLIGFYFFTPAPAGVKTLQTF